MPTLYSRTGHAQLDKAVRPTPVSVAEGISAAAAPEVAEELKIKSIPEPELLETADNSPDVASQQTQFTEDLMIEGMSGRKPVVEPVVLSSMPFWKRHKLPLLGLGLALVTVMTIGIMLPRASQNNEDVLPSPTPSTAAALELSALQREVILLEKDIEQADPLQAKLAFPPVSFTLELQDATALKQNQRSPLR